MRLSEKEVKAFIQVLDPYLTDKNASLYLYGSRTQDHLKGGDIDLLLVLEDPQKAVPLLEKKYEILVRFKEKVGERKIDLTIATTLKTQTELFLKEIMKSTLLLKKWSNYTQ